MDAEKHFRSGHQDTVSVVLNKKNPRIRTYWWWKELTAVPKIRNNIRTVDEVQIAS